MAKRGIIQSNASGVKFRISISGVDVDAAQDHEFLLHENFLFSQPYYYNWVPCSFAGSTSNSALSDTVLLTVPGVTANPVVLLYPQTSDSRNVFPHQRGEGSGNPTNGFAYDRWYVNYKVNSATQIEVIFSKPAGSLRSPSGTFIVLLRDALNG